jgi:YjbE family integral membrane protein
MGVVSAMGFDQPAFWLAVLQIIWVNVLLSGDNAVVIALACRALPPGTRGLGIALGAAVAVILRILFTGIVATLLALPWLKFVGGVALLYIAVGLLKSDDEAEAKVKAHGSLWRAVGTVAVADIVMSLDNVVAIAAIAEGNWWLLSFGLAISIPLIVIGAALITAIFERWPILVWGGGALLGWIAGGLMITDPAIVERIGKAVTDGYELWAAGAGAVMVVLVGYLRRDGTAKVAKAGSPKRIAKSTSVAARRPRARSKAGKR